QRRRRIATKHQPVPLDARKSRARLHQPGAAGATGALQPSEIFCIAGGLRWDAWCLWARAGFRHAPKLSPVLEMLSSLASVGNQFRIANPKAKICDAPEMRPGTRANLHRVNSSVFEKRRNGRRLESLSAFEEFQLNQELRLGQIRTGVSDKRRCGGRSSTCREQ